jgi:hypothetical protein
MSQYFQRIDTMAWTPHMEECLTVLTERGDAPTDMHLVQLVRMSLLKEKVAQVQPYFENTEGSPVATASLMMYLTALQAQARDLKQTIPPQLMKDSK